MAASKGLAQYGVDLEETTALMKAFTEQDKTSHGAMASQAIQGVGAFFSNLQSNAGLSAYLAERVVQREGGIGEYRPGAGRPLNALQAREALLSEIGKEGEGGKILGDVLSEMKKTGGGEFGIEKMYGVNFATAEMISKLTPQQIEGIRSGKAVGGLSDEDVKKLKESFQTSEERENSYKQFLMNAINAFKELLQGILHGVIGIAQVMTGHFTAGKANVGIAVGEAGKVWNLLKQGTKEAAMGIEEAFNVGQEEHKYPTVTPKTEWYNKRIGFPEMYQAAKDLISPTPAPAMYSQAPMTQAQLNAQVNNALAGNSSTIVEGQFDPMTNGLIFKVPYQAFSTMMHQQASRTGSR
jgi:hypothetical protein